MIACSYCLEFEIDGEEEESEEMQSGELDWVESVGESRTCRLHFLAWNESCNVRGMRLQG